MMYTEAALNGCEIQCLPSHYFKQQMHQTHASLYELHDRFSTHNLVKPNFMVQI